MTLSSAIPAAIRNWAGTPAEAVRDADAVLLAVHWLRVDDVLKQAGDLRGKVIAVAATLMAISAWSPWMPVLCESRATWSHLRSWWGSRRTKVTWARRSPIDSTDSHNTVVSEIGLQTRDL